MRIKRTFAAVFGAALLLAGQAFAHHSGAQFDREKTKTTEAIVTRFDFKNPHAYIYVKPTNAKAVEWEFEMMDVANLFRGGWRKNSLVPGDKIKVTYYPFRKEGSGGGLLISVTDPKGKVLYNGPAGAGPAKY